MISRPPNQRAYIASVEARATLAKLKEFAFADPESLALYILNVDQARQFAYILYDLPHDMHRFVNSETVTGTSPRSISFAGVHMVLLPGVLPFCDTSLR